jgi:glutamate carboxypeptidase
METELTTGPAARHAMRAALPAMLADIEALVTCESPSSDQAAVAECAALVDRIGTRLLGAEPERIVVDGVTHLCWPARADSKTASRVLVLGHHDTVWPLGSLAAHPYTVDDGVMRGPGCFDMKAGLVLGLYAVAALREQAAGVTFLSTGDEELGSPSSRELIEKTAAGCTAALVLEASAPGGALKTERKGVSQYGVHAHGRAAHAGLEPEKGVSATVELAHQVLAVNRLGDAAKGTTVTPTLLAAGTAGNTVPAEGHFVVDVRVRDVVEQARVDAAMRALRPVLPGATLSLTGGPNRPPLPLSASAGLFARAALVNVALGRPPLTAAAVGGGSDGNFTAGLGVPTLDGLGAVGGGAHAADEHVVVDALPDRAALVSLLIADLLTGGLQ